MFAVGCRKHFDNGNSIERLRFDVLDIINSGGKRSLRDANDAVAHVLRYETVVVPDDTDNGNVNIRKNVRWRPNNRLAHP